jgi:hypothetical protein
MVLLGVFPRPVGDIATPSVQQTVAVANGSLESQVNLLPGVNPANTP